MGDAQGIQAPEEQVLFVGVFGQQPVIVVLAELQSRHHRLHQGGGAAHGQKVVDLFGTLDDVLRGDDVPQPPAGDGVRLGQGGAGEGPLPHARQGGEVGVLVGGVDDVLVHLVGDDIGVVFLRQGGDDLQLRPGEHLAGGVGGIAQHQGLGVLAEGVLQYLRVKGEVRRIQGHVDGLRPGENGVRTVVLVKGRKDDDLVPGVRHGHHGAHHGLRGAAGGHDLPVGVDGQAHVMALLFGQRLPEVLGAPGDGVLVGAFVGHLGQPVQNGLGRVKVREPLGQVHGAVLQRHPGHAPDHGISEAGGTGGEGTGHGDHSLLVGIGAARHGSFAACASGKGILKIIPKD